MNTNQLQYFSKWRKEWIDFKIQPGKGELAKLKSYHYQIRIKPVKSN